MEVHFTAEQEAQLAQLATEAGADAEHLVKDAALRLLEEELDIPPAASELPVLHLWRDDFTPPPRHLRRCPLNRGLLTQTSSFNAGDFAVFPELTVVVPGAGTKL